jgi:hypothetical protein
MLLHGPQERFIEVASCGRLAVEVRIKCHIGTEMRLVLVGESPLAHRAFPQSGIRAAHEINSVNYDRYALPLLGIKTLLILFAAIRLWLRFFFSFFPLIAVSPSIHLPHN